MRVTCTPTLILFRHISDSSYFCHQTPEAKQLDEGRRKEEKGEKEGKKRGRKKDKRIFWFTVGGYDPPHLENHGNINKRQLDTQCPQFRSRQR